MVDVVLVAQARTGPDAIHRFSGRAHAIDRRPGEAGVACGIDPCEQRVGEGANVRSTVVAVGLDQPDPLRHEHGLDPHVVMRERMPDLEWDAEVAETPQEGFVDLQRGRRRHHAAPRDVEDRLVARGPAQVVRGHIADHLRNLGKTLVQVLRRLVAEHGADPQFDRGHGPQRGEAVGDETGAGPLRHLGQGMFDQGLVHAQPKERYKTQRHDHGFRVVAGQPRRGIRDAGQYAQQRDLVRRRLFVHEDQVPQQGQGAQAVVGEPQHDVRPRHFAPPQLVLAVAGVDDAQAELLGKAGQFRQRDLVHRTFGVGRAEPEADRDASFRRQQRRQLAQRTLAIGWRNVHPDGGQQDEVEAQAEAAHVREVRQAVGQPLDPARRVFCARVGEHGFGWLDGHDVVSLCREPRRVPAGTCADIEDRAARRRQYADQVRVNVLKRQRLVLSNQPSCVLFVIGDS